MQPNNIRELVKVRNKLEAWQEAAQRSVDHTPDSAVVARSRNLVSNYGALIAQLDDVLSAELST
jgi:hypothetical protein